MKFSTRRCLVSIIAFAILIFAVGVSAAQEPASFRVVLLPDPQYYSESYPETYMVQTRWIKQRTKLDNIKFVIHLGDIVQNPHVEQEWKNADRAHRVIDGVVPYSILPGNHDMAHKDKQITRGTPLYNKYFGPERFEKYPWYGGNMDGTNDDNYCFFEAAGMKFIVLSLEYCPSDAMLQWAAGVIDSHKDHRVILATHYYMRPGGRGTPSQLGGNSGEQIWQKFVRKHENIFMVVSGHVLGVGHQTSINDAGGKAHEILSDYQGLPNGGNGWLQWLRFVPSENKIYVEAYSPLLDKHDKRPKHTYTLDYDMGVANSRS